MNATLERATRTREETACDRIRVFGLRALGRHTDITFSVTRESAVALATFSVRYGKTTFTDMELSTITKVKEAIKQKFSLKSALTLVHVNATIATMRIPLC